MAIADTVVISPVELGAVNQPKILDLYQHKCHREENLIQEYADVADALQAAEELGPNFRSKFTAEAQDGDFGYGIYIPMDIWKNIKETATANTVRPNLYYIGPATQPVARLMKLTYRVDQEGIRLYEDISGQDWSAGAPNPNQTSMHLVMDDTVYTAIQGDFDYFTMIGPDKDAFDEMTTQHQDDLRDWENSQGITNPFLATLRSLARTLTIGEETLTYGKAALVIAAWQSLLTPSGPVEIEPDYDVLKLYSQIMSSRIRKPLYT